MYVALDMALDRWGSLGFGGAERRFAIMCALSMAAWALNITA